MNEVAKIRADLPATADATEVRDVVEVHIREAPEEAYTVLFDAEHNLEERILNEQFAF